MKKEMQRKIAKALFEKDRDLFFDKLFSIPKEEIENNPFILEEANSYPEFNPETKNHEHVCYKLKDEINDLLPQLSLIEMMQIADIGASKDIQTIKKWVTFMGIVLLVGICFYLIALVYSVGK